MDLPADGRSRADHVYTELLKQIRSGTLKSGMRMREEDIARALDVSRTPAREGLARLQARGLIELSNGRLTVTTLDRQQVLELYALRGLLEGAAARFAAQHANPSEVTLLQRLCDRFEQETRPARMAAINREFHDRINEASHNRYLQRSLYELHDTIALLPHTTFQIGGRPSTAAAEHRAIVAAIAAHDPDLAETEGRKHIEKALEARLELSVASATES